MRSVLVLDGNQRSALAVTRSLGAKGIRVIVADERAQSIAASSRFCAESFSYPSPHNHPTAFLQSLADACRSRRVDVLYPMSDISMYHVLKNRHHLGDVRIPFGSFEAYERLTNKWTLFELAARLGLRIPTTHFVNGAPGLAAIVGELRFPVVIKPFRSQLWSNGRWVHASVHYADTFEELQSTVTGLEYLAGQPFLLQEYIHGENRGIFAISDHGVPQSFFANRRIRDVPPMGGMVVLAESIVITPAMRLIAERLLSHVGWHGVAMIECKVRDGVHYILETNARFWASTQLAVDCGVDYPWLLYQLALGEKPDVITHYDASRRLRNLVGDVEHYYMNLAGIGLNRYESEEERRNALRGFWSAWQAQTFYEINRSNDLRPFAVELFQRARMTNPFNVLRNLLTAHHRQVQPATPAASPVASSTTRHVAKTAPSYEESDRGACPS